MTHRTAALVAYQLTCNEAEDLAQFGLSLLADLAQKECYLAKLSMVYVYDQGRLVAGDPVIAQAWVDRARAMHDLLTDPDDLYDAGMKCKWDGLRFAATESDAIALWEKSAALGNGEALYAICDVTRHQDDHANIWLKRLTIAAQLGCTQAMTELAGQEGIRGTARELIWLRAAAELGSLRAKEMLE